MTAILRMGHAEHLPIIFGTLAIDPIILKFWQLDLNIPAK